MKKKNILRFLTLMLMILVMLSGCGTKSISEAEYNKVGINKVILGKKATKKQLDSLIMDSDYLHQDGPVEFNADKQGIIYDIFLPTSTTVHGVVSGFRKEFHNTLYYRGEKLSTEEEIIDYLRSLKDVVPTDKYVEDFTDDMHFTITVYEDDYYIELYKSNEYVNVTIAKID